MPFLKVGTLAQLPPATAGFSGRDGELGILAALLVSAVPGPAGVDKTTLAVQAGHAVVRSGWFGGGGGFVAAVLCWAVPGSAAVA